MLLAGVSDHEHWGLVIEVKAIRVGFILLAQT